MMRILLSNFNTPGCMLHGGRRRFMQLCLITFDRLSFHKYGAKEIIPVQRG